MRNFISQDLALYLYNSLIKPVFTYCDYIYDGCGKTVSKQLETLNNGALKAVKNINHRYSATALHDDLGVPWLYEMRKQSTCVELYKMLDGKGPPSLTREFKYKEPVRTLRSNDNADLIRPRTKTKMAEQDFVIRAMTYWEVLPIGARSAETVDILKESLKNNRYFK